MLTIKPASQLYKADSCKIKSVIDAIEMMVLKTKQRSSKKYCNLPINYSILNQSEKDDLDVILLLGGYRITDKGENWTYDQVEWD